MLDGEGKTPLHVAVRAGSVLIIEALCRSKVSPDYHTAFICCMPVYQDSMDRHGKHLQGCRTCSGAPRVQPRQGAYKGLLLIQGVAERTLLHASFASDQSLIGKTHSQKPCGVQRTLQHTPSCTECCCKG